MHAPVSKPTIDRTGLIQGVAAYSIWGVLPLYFLLLEGVGSSEVVASRVIWSLVLLTIVVLAMRRGDKLLTALRDRRVMLALTASAALISVNWLVYIWAVQHQQVLAGSLGYFLNPLINVLLGVVVLRERLTRLQGLAVGIAAVGVAVLAAGAGEGLWISLTLAMSFALYGLVRKMVRVESIEGLALETAILTPFALAYLAWMASTHSLAFGDRTDVSILLVLTGIVTAVPLLLFAASARRLPYAMVGLLQYIAPTLQFALAVLWLGEPLTTAHIICFVCIWTGLALYVGSGFLPKRRPVPAG
ncbi:EamA family transporter RarD [Sphingomonas qomolangmaensis]|uniref:EamA family transporter RarD n=1 Tax=Sphingomonas qomolangmaensis TaxID=2918765 RepID=A0ABY5LBH2_9SPHN|nr:EamA family transporter RarD [Sphingomonas qomolangmaensis]UUL84117.1 EamA family transporter RarD [Sphingomonas qomolangmaensis]